MSSFRLRGRASGAFLLALRCACAAQLQSTEWRLRLDSFVSGWVSQFGWVVCELAFYSDAGCSQLLNPLNITSGGTHGGGLPTQAFDNNTGTWSASECGSYGAFTCNASTAWFGVRLDHASAVSCVKLLHFGNGNAATSDCTADAYGWDTGGTTRAAVASLEALVSDQWEQQASFSGLGSAQTQYLTFTTTTTTTATATATTTTTSITTATSTTTTTASQMHTTLTTTERAAVVQCVCQCFAVLLSSAWAAAAVEPGADFSLGSWALRFRLGSEFANLGPSQLPSTCQREAPCEQYLPAGVPEGLRLSASCQGVAL